MSSFSRTVLSSLLVLLVGSSWSTSGQVLAVDPVTFFGGVDNADYVAWANEVNYESFEFIPAEFNKDLGVAVHWNISSDKEYLELGVAVKASGWFGFGISESGGMRGSDVLIFEARNPQVIKDMHIGDVRIPQEDECEDWELISSSTDTDFLMIQVRRKLDTMDTQDMPVVDDTSLDVPVTRLISAWGDSEQFSFHGQNYARGTVRWYTDGAASLSFVETVVNQSDGSFWVGAENFTLPPVETHYEYICFDADDLIAQGVPLDAGVSVIGFEPIITSPYVHHFLVFGSNNAKPANCDRFSYLELSYIWGPGDPNIIIPENLGAPVGGDSFRSFLIEIHYHNPQLESGIVDSSGIRHYYSTTPRETEIGIMQLGDAFVGLDGTDVGTGLTEHQFSCPSGCSQTFFREPVTVIREVHHMHETGTSAVFTVNRGGEVVHEATTEYFDFEMQGGQVIVQEPYVIQPGDSFDMKCFYDNPSTESRKFGIGSSDEMCIFFLFYAPRQTLELGAFGRAPFLCTYNLPILPPCDASWDGGASVDLAALGRTFGTAPESCPGETKPPTPAPLVGAAPSTSAGTAGTPTSSAAYGGATSMFVVGMIVTLMLVSVALN